ncbi:Fanconi-associated nuclease [Heracleum sosnowskyi]|uniref:Fanconi-associated nuclease n=1 Tax=Heracleum sosnowskyi TaxID=360622 RepID=A0AAD8IU69_9APIA|nr:Fanconi-associated nuclease [Heracleum sosnowskyi]
MLTGRESLVRLIGKRRRYLPNRQAIVSNPISQSVLSDERSGGEGDGSSCSNAVEVSVSDWVTCPVCRSNVRGDDRIINSHLDDCLTRGTKRKLSQRTLLDWNFSRGSNKSEQTEVNVVETSPDNDVCGIVNNPSDPVVENDDSLECETSNNRDHILHTPVVASVEKPLLNGKLNHIDSRRPASVQNSRPHNAETVDDIYGYNLITHIVARKFCDKVEINPGDTISLMRDPSNTKDPNAIKVLTADHGITKTVGFLPRDLAQYLSPLMDKFGLHFEGSITSVPDRPLAAIPVQIVCCKKIYIGENECEDNQIFNSLWKHVIDVVKLEKSFPGNTKYQHNFILMLQEVLRTNPHLLTADEKTFLESFISLSDDGQRLFVRLYTRKGPWFRLANISYSEILDCQLAATELFAAGYVCLIESKNDIQKDDLEEVLNVLAVGELREIRSTMNKNSIRGGSRKQDLIALLTSTYKDKLCAIFEKTGVCIRISPKADSLIWRVERLFFLDGELDLSTFLLVDMGIVKYPSYNCIISDQIFSCRDDLLSYEEAIEVAQIMDQALEENNRELILRCINLSDSRVTPSTVRTHESSPVPFFSRFTSSWVYSKVVLLGVSFLEHENRYIDAIRLLKRLLLNFTSDRRRGYWTLRLSMDLEHLGRHNESLTIAENGLLDPWVRAGTRISLQRRVLRLGKPPRRWKTPTFSESVQRKITEVHVQGRPLNCVTGTKSRFYGEDGEQCGVEQLALQYYAGEGGGWQGIHAESGIWLTIFGLLMWDIMFTDVPNVFRNLYQTAPLDMETDSFYEARKSLVESLLQKVQNGMAEEILITSWELHFGTSCRGVKWDNHSLSDLRAIVTCIGGPCLASICRHLAQDYRSWSSGMPDLLLWRFHGDNSGEAKLVEVKGPRDRLSEQQRAWLLFLMDAGFNAEICKVSPLR